MWYDAVVRMQREEWNGEMASSRAGGRRESNDDGPRRARRANSTTELRVQLCDSDDQLRSFTRHHRFTHQQQHLDQAPWASFASMALPPPLQPGLLPTEIEYLATTTTHVQIVPLTSIDRARFLSGVYGPFRPPQRTTVPLWLALNLRAKGKCYLVPPEWMELENVKALLQRETTSMAFAEVPWHYVEIARAILEA